MVGLTLDPLVHTIFAGFLCVLTNCVVSVSCLGFVFFVPTGVESKCDIFSFLVFVPIGVESKGDRLIEIFWRSNSLFSFQF